MVGYSNAIDPYHAFLYDHGTMVDLGTFGGRSGRAFGINNSGQIVGSCETSDSGTHACFYYNVVTTNLNEVIAPVSGWTLYEADAINDSGQIAGTMINASGQLHAYLLTPVPEPSTLALLGISAVALVGYGWRRRKKLHI